MVEKHFVYILELAVHTVQRNWTSRLGRYLMRPGLYADFLVPVQQVPAGEEGGPGGLPNPL